MTLRDQIIADAADVFLKDSEFAESVTYYPVRFATDPLRQPRAIVANVVRNQISAADQDVESVLPEFEVHVANDATLGISSTEIDTGGDMIEIATRPGKTPQKRSIQFITDQDEGMMVLICR